MTPAGQPANRGKRVSEAEFSRLWYRADLTTADIGRILGIRQSAVTQRARNRGLPDRRSMGLHRDHSIIVNRVLFCAMWHFGVSRTEMAAHFCISDGSVKKWATRFQLPRRQPWHPSLYKTVADYASECLRRRLARDARETQAVLHLCEMVDRKALSSRRKAA